MLALKHILCYESNHNKYMLAHCIKALHEKEKGMPFGKLLLSVPAALYFAMIFGYMFHLRSGTWTPSKKSKQSFPNSRRSHFVKLL